jgi:hypothetical protein
MCADFPRPSPSACTPCLLMCFCRPAVLSGTSKTVTCNKPDPAGWPATFNVNVTATATNAGCPASASGASAVTVYTRPVVNVTGDSTAQLCDNATQLVLTYGVSSGESGAPLTINVTAPGVDCSSPATGEGKTALGLTDAACSTACSELQGAFGSHAPSSALSQASLF